MGGIMRWRDRHPDVDQHGRHHALAATLTRATHRHTHGIRPRLSSRDTAEARPCVCTQRLNRITIGHVAASLSLESALWTVVGS